jgi:agmatinase
MEDTAPVGFLGLPEESRRAESSLVHVLPVPFEATVSYGAGTRGGPDALITASQQVELYDPATDSEPALSAGVHTLPPVSGMDGLAAMTARVADAAEAVLRAGKLLLALGGEHSITPALVRGVRRVIGEPLVIVQIDAHADLRDSYQGESWSHACAMRRVMEENPGPAVQIGIRSYSREEAEYLKENRSRITLWSAEALHPGNHPEFLDWLRATVRGKKTYVTIDVDGLDPSVVPATGTPEPDGLAWRQAVEILGAVAAAAEVVGIDCVELAPQPGHHIADFAVARLLAETLNRIMTRRAQA